MKIKTKIITLFVTLSFYFLIFFVIVIYKFCSLSQNKIGVNNSFEKYIPETARELLNIVDNKRNSEVKLTIEEL